MVASADHGPPLGLPLRVAVAARDFAERVRKRFGPRVRDIRLYGSYAREEARTDSDVDIYVEIEALGHRERGDVFDMAAEVSIAHLVTVQAFAPGSDERDWLERNECRILSDIAAEGISL